MSEEKLEVTIEQVNDFQFNVTFNPENVELLMDEPEPVGLGKGPNASKVLSAAVGNCLTASLLFCLQKARAEPKYMKTKVVTSLERNEQKRMRIGGADVEITVDMDVEAAKRMDRCLGIFESFCVVTQSVRNGIDVKVKVLDTGGEVLYDSRNEG